MYIKKKKMIDVLNSIIAASSKLSEASSNASGIALGVGIPSLGVLGTAVGQAYTCGKDVEAVARNPEAESKIRTILIVGEALAKTSAIYSLIIANLLVFFLIYLVMKKKTKLTKLFLASLLLTIIFLVFCCLFLHAHLLQLIKIK